MMSFNRFGNLNQVMAGMVAMADLPVGILTLNLARKVFSTLFYYSKLK